MLLVWVWLWLWILLLTMEGHARQQVVVVVVVWVGVGLVADPAAASPLPPHMRPPPHVSLCLQLPLMVLVLGWCSKKGRIVQVGGGVEGGCSVAGSAAAAAFAAAASPCAERWMWPCTLSVAVCCPRTRSEPKPTTTLSFPVHRLACTRQGKETTSTLLQARCDVGTGHTSLPPCRWNSRRRPTEHNHDRRELGGNLPLEQQSRCWGVKAGFSSDPWRLVRVLHPRGPWVQAAFERRCRSACTCHHLWVQISGSELEKTDFLESRAARLGIFSVVETRFILVCKVADLSYVKCE